MGGTHTSVSVEYHSVFFVPALIASVVNFAVFIVIRRSDVLQNSKFLRHDLFLNLALGNFVALLVYCNTSFFAESLHHDFMCRFTLYIAEVGQSVIQASLIVAALSRYLNIVNRYHSAVGLLRRTPMLLLWVLVAILCAPYTIPTGAVSYEYSAECDFLPETSTDLFWTASATLDLVPTVIYGVLVHLTVKVLPEEDALNDEAATLRFASRIVRLSFVVALVIFAPLQIITCLLYNFIGSLYALCFISPVLLALVSILEPVCYAILSSVFQDEYRHQISQTRESTNAILDGSFDSAVPPPV